MSENQALKQAGLNLYCKALAYFRHGPPENLVVGENTVETVMLPVPESKATLTLKLSEMPMPQEVEKLPKELQSYGYNLNVRLVDENGDRVVLQHQEVSNRGIGSQDSLSWNYANAIQRVRDHKAGNTQLDLIRTCTSALEEALRETSIRII